MTTTSHRSVLFIILTAVVCIAAATTGGYYGGLVRGLYTGKPISFEERMESRHPSIRVAADYVRRETRGTLIGAAAGLAAGLLWSLAMNRLALAMRRVRRFRLVSLLLVPAGCLLGLAAGALAAVLLHLVLMAVTGFWDLERITIGLRWAVHPGFTLGLACGLLWWLVCAAAARLLRPLPPQAAESAP